MKNPQLLVKTGHVISPHKVVVYARIKSALLIGQNASRENSVKRYNHRSFRLNDFRAVNIVVIFIQACNYYDVLVVLISSCSFLISSANVTILNILELIHFLLNELINTLKCFF